MKFLFKDRYNDKKDKWRIKVDFYPEKIHNYKKGMIILKEVYLESLRAP